MESQEDTVLVGSGIAPIASNYESEAEKALAQRFQRRNIFNQELVFEFTRDPALLKQYYRIREYEFKAVLGTYNYSGQETEHDKNGQVMVIRKGNFCIGGWRVNVKTPRKPNLLPLEIKDFRIEDHFPDLRHRQVSYGQLGMYAILPEYRQIGISHEGFKRMFSRAAAMNLDVLFTASPMLNSRLYKKECALLGMKDTKIHLDIELPVYPGLEEVKLYLMSIPIDKSVVQTYTDISYNEADEDALAEA